MHFCIFYVLRSSDFKLPLLKLPVDRGASPIEEKGFGTIDVLRYKMCKPNTYLHESESGKDAKLLSSLQRNSLTKDGLMLDSSHPHSLKSQFLLKGNS